MGDKEKDDSQIKNEEKWKEEVDLSHFPHEGLKERILKMFGNYSRILDGHLGEIKGMEHQIELKDDAVNVQRLVRDRVTMHRNISGRKRVET